MRAATRLALSGVLLIGAATSIRADIIYDTLWIHDKGVMDAGTGNAIGGANAVPGRTIDAQIADDFLIEETRRITSVVTDIMAHNDTIPAEGVWV